MKLARVPSVQGVTGSSSWRPLRTINHSRDNALLVNGRRVFKSKHMKKIPLTRGYFALVDDEDYERVRKIKWYFDEHGGYAIGRINGRSKSMHRFIMKAPKGKQVDHRNMKGLDNRRSNLSICTAQQNAFNRKIHPRNKSGYRNVTWSKKEQKWETNLYLKGRCVFIGYFENIQHAALAADLWRVDIHGKYANTNFPVVSATKRAA